MENVLGHHKDSKSKTITQMKASEKLINHIKKSEGLSLTAYTDAKGVWTIGYGHTGGVRKGEKITEAVADVYLRRDLDVSERAVNQTGLAKTQGQFDALVDFVYNVGMGNLTRSTLKKKIKSGAPTAEIQAEFRRWVYSGKKKLNGLVTRREWEAIRWAEKE